MIKIEFGLPSGSGGMAAGQHNQYIRKLLLGWSSRYNIAVTTGSARHDHRHWLQVEFAREEDLTMFALTWNHKTFMQWKLVDGPNGS
jgi:hypothetical protein